MPKRLSVVDIDLCVGCQSCMFTCNRRFAEAGLARSAIKIQSLCGYERGFVVKVCRACADPPCAKACPTSALKKRAGGGVILNYEKCKSCGNCAKECIVGGVQWDTTTDKPAICVHCGYCVKYCSYGVIRLEEITAGEV